ncbi:hypothetical protein LCL97_09725 [Seohaeicola saemankumensis]|nr:hypothetical protein [Seohaeicola saemankumensis]MCA0871106.1 hypothetical protein [Seohaeicola saemankumensis]
MTKTPFVALVAALIPLSGHAGSMDELLREIDRSPSLETASRNCASRVKVGSSAAVRACTTSIRRNSEVIAVADTTLSKLKRSDATKREGLSKDELRDAIETVSAIKRTSYFGAGMAYAARGISLSSIEPAKAKKDCIKAAEIQRFLKDNRLLKLLETCEEAVTLFLK